jgi:hypothetical protein
MALQDATSSGRAFRFLVMTGSGIGGDQEGDLLGKPGNADQLAGHSGTEPARVIRARFSDS